MIATIHDEAPPSMIGRQRDPAFLLGSLRDRQETKLFSPRYPLRMP
jgi:hypothetical protein